MAEGITGARGVAAAAQNESLQASQDQDNQNQVEQNASERNEDAVSVDISTEARDAQNSQAAAQQSAVASE